MVTTTRAYRPVRPFAASGFAPSRKCETGTCHLFEETLEQRGHVAQPKREEQHQVLGPLDRILCGDQSRRQSIQLPFELAAQ